MFSILEQLFDLGTVLTCDVPRVLPHVSFHKCTTPEHSVVIVIVNIHTVIQFLLVMYPSTCHVSAHTCLLTRVISHVYYCSGTLSGRCFRQHTTYCVDVLLLRCTYSRLQFLYFGSQIQIFAEKKKGSAELVLTNLRLFAVLTINFQVSTVANRTSTVHIRFSVFQAEIEGSKATVQWHILSVFNIKQSTNTIQRYKISFYWIIQYFNCQDMWYFPMRPKSSSLTTKV